MVMGVNGSYSNSTTRTENYQSQQRLLSQEAINKIIYDVMGADGGLASLATGENMAGGFGSSSKGLLTQDFMTKVAGEMAALTAENVTKSKGTSNTSGFSVGASAGTTAPGANGGGGKGSIICTWLKDQKRLDIAVYYAGQYHFSKLNPATIRGYHFWAIPLTKKLHKLPKTVAVLEYLVKKRYQHVLGGPNIVGWLTVVLGHPACYVLGKILSGVEYGRDCAIHPELDSQ